MTPEPCTLCLEGISGGAHHQEENHGAESLWQADTTLRQWCKMSIFPSIAALCSLQPLEPELGSLPCDLLPPLPVPNWSVVTDAGLTLAPFRRAKLGPFPGFHLLSDSSQSDAIPL